MDLRASTSRIADSSSPTLCLPIKEATSPSAECASFSFSSSRESTRRSPEKSGSEGSRISEEMTGGRRWPYRSMRPLRCSMRISDHGMS
ncbi:Uncharacterised protein [Mycobacteroides abscessus subsp. abscessus]|nr:Uncharacterised protein [Mycobacteroides abscessus subsp. abscessus]